MSGRCETSRRLIDSSNKVLGFVLLAFEKYNAAKLMFERSLEEKMGRVWSLVGLARSHTMLGDSTKARAANDPSVFTITDVKQALTVGRCEIR